MIVAQDSAHVPPVALANHASVAQTSAPWRSPVQIHHLVVVAIPDPSQPAVDRVLLAPHRQLPMIEQFAQRVVWQLAQEPPQESRSGQAHGGSSRATEGAGGGGDVVGDDDAGRLGRPLVLCASRDDTLELHVTNLLPAMGVSLGLVDDDLGMQAEPTQAAAIYGETQVYTFHCPQPGIFPIFNRAGVDEAHARCLLGVLMVEA